MNYIEAFIESFGKMLYVFCISIAILSLSVILFLWATEWLWPELHGSKKIGDGIYLFEFDGGPIIVKGNSISGNTCYGGEGIIPNMQFDSLCERVDKYEFDEKLIISPISLHTTCSLTPKNQPMEHLPRWAIPLKTLCCNILWFLHTRSGVLSMILIPVHLPIRTSLTNAISFNTATFCNSTKRL